MRTVLGEGFEDSVWRGYDQVNRGMRAFFAGDIPAAFQHQSLALTIADRFGDADLRVLAGNGHGQARLAEGDVDAGLAELDEVLVLATTAPANPQLVGVVYCAVIANCRECLAVERGAEWTQVLDDWCSGQPDLVPFRGTCQVNRSEPLALHGQWGDAVAAAQFVLDRLPDVPRDPAAGAAYYQRGELHRVRGEYAEAEDDYREALRRGLNPQPGLALLRVGQGRADIAVVALRRALEEPAPRHHRTRLLRAMVDVAVAAGELVAARAAADELGMFCEGSAVGFLRAAAALAAGGVSVAEGDAQGALPALRAALDGFTAVDVPYEAARCRVLLAVVYRLLGDVESAELAVQDARATFRSLGALPDLDRLDEPWSGTGPGRAPGGLTRREVEVLRLVATGASNREIAGQLYLSERTVARHLANIFVKVDVSSRAGAAAYAYAHRLA